MQSWLATPRGHLMLRRERKQMRSVLPHVFGYRLLQIGDWDFDEDVLESSATLCHWVVGQAQGADVLFNGEALPISSRSVDAVVLPHSLETLASPHPLLREVDRILCDHGHLIILGFNPFSPWAVRRRFSRRIRRLPLRRRYYSLGRVSDWLELLDYELLSASRFGVGFPYLPEGGIDVASAGLWRLPGGMAQAYAIVARKRVVAMTQQRRQARKSALSVRGMPEPSTRGASRQEAA